MDNRFKHPFAKIAPAYREMRKRLPKEISDIAVDEFKGNFKVGGYRGDSGTTFWKERKQKKGNKGRGLLIKSGRLRRGIRPYPTYESARVINDVPYAKALNEGFKGTVRVKSHNRRRLGTLRHGTGVFNVRTRKEKFKTSKTVKSIISVKSHKRKMNLVARPFMISGKPLLNNIDKHITTQLDKLWQNL